MLRDVRWTVQRHTHTHLWVLGRFSWAKVGNTTLHLGSTPENLLSYPPPTLPPRPPSTPDVPPLSISFPVLMSWLRRPPSSFVVNEQQVSECSSLDHGWDWGTQLTAQRLFFSFFFYQPGMKGRVCSPASWSILMIFIIPDRQEIKGRETKGDVRNGASKQCCNYVFNTWTLKPCFQERVCVCVCFHCLGAACVLTIAMQCNIVQFVSNRMWNDTRFTLRRPRQEEKRSGVDWIWQIWGSVSLIFTFAARGNKSDCVIWWF